MENERKSVIMATKVTPSEADKIDKDVQRTGHTLSSWLRLAAVEAVKTGIVANVEDQGPDSPCDASPLRTPRPAGLLRR